MASLRSITVFWIASAQFTAPTAPANSARMPSPAVPMMRQPCSPIIGRMTVAEGFDFHAVRSCTMDGELTACGDSAIPDFNALHFNSRPYARCVWAFDLLYLNGKDLRSLRLVDRKEQLERLVSKIRHNWLCYSETFADGATLLKARRSNGPRGHRFQRRRTRPTDPAHSATGSR